jgi:tetratricopeptide (TPR) repeat protein
MIRKPWLSVLCGSLLLVTPLMVRADSGGGNGGGSTGQWNSPQEKSASPAKVQTEYEAGYRYLKAGDYKKAIKAFETVLKENPSHALAYSNMGYSYRKLKQYDKALELYGKALMLDPKLAEAHEYMGEAYLEMGNIEEAKQHLTILEKLDPKLAEELRAEITRHDKRS